MTDNVKIAKSMTCEMFSESIGYDKAANVIRHFLASLPKNEIPYEQAALYRKLVGME